MTGRYSLASAAVAAGIFLVGPTATNAQSSPAGVAGDWKNVIVREFTGTASQCRAIRAETRVYRLTARSNGEVSGSYLRGLEYLWLMAGPECRVGTETGELPKPRTDSWLISGRLQPDGSARLQGTPGRCMGECSDTTIAQPFEASLRRDGEVLLDTGSQAPSELMRFVDAKVADQDAAAAATALPDLIQPLLQADCNSFYARALDPGMQRAVPSDRYCSVAGALGRLLSGAISNRPAFAYRMSFASFVGPPQYYAGDGDVLVGRRLVMTADGQEVPFNAILRRQADGSWRFLRTP